MRRSKFTPFGTELAGFAREVLVCRAPPAYMGARWGAPMDNVEVLEDLHTRGGGGSGTTVNLLLVE